MNTYPLNNITLYEARQLQYKIVDSITREFEGSEILTRGDMGVVPGFNKPQTTLKAERVIARIFDAEACQLVRGAGTGAIRFGLSAMMKPGGTLLIHRAPVYNTTKDSIEMMGLKTVEADYNDLDDLKHTLKLHPEISGALVQYTRQKMDDRYQMEDVIKTIKCTAATPVLTDDNYAVMKVQKTGIQCGADLSCFSGFKLLGPEGIGCIIGNKSYIDIISKQHYSGGMQTQGFEALDVLRGFTYAPVALAIQAEVNEELVTRLNAGEIPQVKEACLANAQSKVLLVELNKEIADAVLAEAQKLGAAPNPIGAESKYEIVPMFYRISGTFRVADKTLEKRIIRINPMRSGADTVIRILEEAIKRAELCS